MCRPVGRGHEYVLILVLWTLAVFYNFISVVGRSFRYTRRRCLIGIIHSNDPIVTVAMSFVFLIHRVVMCVSRGNQEGIIATARASHSNAFLSWIAGAAVHC